MATLRNLAIGILRLCGHTSIAAALRHNAVTPSVCWGSSASQPTNQTFPHFDGALGPALWLHGLAGPDGFQVAGPTADRSHSRTPPRESAKVEVQSGCSYLPPSLATPSRGAGTVGAEGLDRYPRTGSGQQVRTSSIAAGGVDNYSRNLH